jgi:hypothetical protein
MAYVLAALLTVVVVGSTLLVFGAVSKVGEDREEQTAEMWYPRFVDDTPKTANPEAWTDKEQAASAAPDSEADGPSRG